MLSDLASLPIRRNADTIQDLHTVTPSLPVNRSSDQMERLRRKIDDVIACMVGLDGNYSEDQLTKAYRAALRKRFPAEKIRIDTLRGSGTLWEWLFGFAGEARSYLHRGERDKLNPIKLRHIRAIRDVLFQLRACIDGPKLTPEPESWERFLDHVLERLASPPPLFYVPFNEPPYFIGRDGVLEEIDIALKPSDPGVSVVALHGMRGVGKTALAATYAHRHRADFCAVMWIGAHNELVCRNGFLSLGLRLGCIEEGIEEDRAIHQIREYLARLSAPLLLVFDNVPDVAAVRQYLPHGGGCKFLITSNFHDWSDIATAIKLRPWLPDAGADYLIARFPRSEPRSSAEDLSELLGGLPLALAQAAAFCARYGFSFATYIELYNQSTQGLLDDSMYAPADYHPEYEAENKSRLTVANTFRLAIQALRNSYAEAILFRVALLASDPVPWGLFEKSCAKLGEPFSATTTSQNIRDGIGELLALALVEPVLLFDERDTSISAEAISLHRLVREIAAAELSDDRRTTLELGLAEALAAIYPRDAYQNAASWFECSNLTPHVLELWERKVPWKPDPLAWPSVVDRVVGYLHQRARYSQAEALMREIVAYTEQVVGPNDLEVAAALNSLAVLLGAQEKRDEARRCLRRALAIRLSVLPEDHPLIASSLDSIACSLHGFGDLRQSRALFARALDIRREKLGPNDPDTALTENNLAFLLMDMGKDAEAIPLLEHALTVFESREGENLRIAAVLSNLGKLLIPNDRAKARDMLTRSLAIYERRAGPDHPDTAMAHNNLALLYDWVGDLASARHHLERSLAITERSPLGPDNIGAGSVLANLSRVLYLLRDPAWQAMSKRALRIFRAHRHRYTGQVRFRHWWNRIFWYLAPLIALGTLCLLLWVASILIRKIVAWIF